LRKLSLLQKITIAAIVIYAIWEVIIQIWMRTLPERDPVLRIDLLLAYPVLLILIVSSVVQMLIRKKRKTNS
jgi:hypothetical protein